MSVVDSLEQNFSDKLKTNDKLTIVNKHNSAHGCK